MSRVGKYPVNVPSDVTVAINGQEIKVKGKLGELSYTAPACIKVTFADQKLHVEPQSKEKDGAYWGTVRSLLNGMVTGVSKGFSKKLELVGVGFKAQVAGNNLKMSLGFSHDVDYKLPEGVKAACSSPTNIEISGIDKRLVGQVAAEIRSFKLPEPYKGKGIKYENEYIFRKEGKKK